MVFSDDLQSTATAFTSGTKIKYSVRLLKKDLMLPRKPRVALPLRRIFLGLLKSDDYPVFSLQGGENKQITFFDGWGNKVIDSYCL